MTFDLLVRTLKEWDESAHPRDDHGRFDSGGGGAGTAVLERPTGAALSGSAASALLDRLAAEGGFSYQVVDGTSPKDGYMVSRWPERSYVGDKGAFSPATLQQYVQRNADVLGKNYLGGWHDTATGKIYLDVSQRVDTTSEADALCRQYGQRAYFGIKEGDEFRVLSESEAHKHVQRQWEAYWRDWRAGTAEAAPGRGRGRGRGRGQSAGRSAQRRDSDGGDSARQPGHVLNGGRHSHVGGADRRDVYGRYGDRGTGGTGRVLAPTEPRARKNRRLVEQRGEWERRLSDADARLALRQLARTVTLWSDDAAPGAAPGAATTTTSVGA